VNRDAVGARAYVTTPDGVRQMQDVIAGTSLGAGNELALYFGLGTARRADVTIRWPDGTEQVFKGVAANRRYQLGYPADGPTRLEPMAGTAAAGAGRSVERPGAWAAEAVAGLGWAVPGLVLVALAIWPGRGRGRAPEPGRTIERSYGLGMMSLGLVGLAGAIVLMPRPGRLPLSALWDSEARLRGLMAQAGVQPPTSPPAPRPALVALGEALFWDPELSGNRDMACATCHHSLTALGDDLSVSIGTTGQGLGVDRVRLSERHEFIPRNAQPVFNLGYLEWEILFWDGRVSGTAETGFESPASDRLPAGLDNLLAAQAMFPVTSRDEMRGLRGDRDIFGERNELAMLPDYAARPIWAALMKRLLAIPGYVALFRAAYPDVPLEQLGFQHAANGLAAYEIAVFSPEDSPFDRYIRGDAQALTADQKRGAELFYGEAGCGACHSGGLLTDQKFYNLAVPQVGPGKGREEPLDLGRARETGNDCDRFAFRTQPLRNVAITGPWMHNGAFMSLEAAVRHHLNPAESLRAYDPAQLDVMFQDMCQDQPEVLAAVLRTQSEAASAGVGLTDAQMADLLAFLDALTSPRALDLEDTIPESVPSGLPVGGNIENVVASGTGSPTDGTD
jgi:cytochrome c peroxidase